MVLLALYLLLLPCFFHLTISLDLAAHISRSYVLFRNADKFVDSPVPKTLPVRPLTREDYDHPGMLFYVRKESGEIGWVFVECVLFPGVEEGEEEGADLVVAREVSEVAIFHSFRRRSYEIVELQGEGMEGYIWLKNLFGHSPHANGEKLDLTIEDALTHMKQFVDERLSTDEGRVELNADEMKSLRYDVVDSMAGEMSMTRGLLKKDDSEEGTGRGGRRFRPPHGVPIPPEIVERFAEEDEL